jgi:hypothetical protein
MEILIGAGIIFGIFMLYAFIDGLFLSKIRKEKFQKRQRERQREVKEYEERTGKLHCSRHRGYWTSHYL